MEKNENGFSDHNPERNENRNNSCPGTGEKWRAEGGAGVKNNQNPQLASPESGCSERQLAMVYSPHQCFRMLYSPERALERGTLFEELDKPLEDCVNG